MDNRRARRRIGRHPSDGLDEFQRRRAQRPPNFERIEAAYRRMAEAERLVQERFEQQDGGRARRDDPVRQLLRHEVMPENGDLQLWLVGLGEKVAALGGHLQVSAVFDDGELTLIREPGPENQPPILPDPASSPAVEDLTPEEPFDPRKALSVSLAGDERELILAALIEWGGVGRASEELAIAMEFAGLEDFEDQRERLIEAVGDEQPLTPFDWRRVLIATEISYASDYFAAGSEWETITGLNDQTSLLTLRDIQDKLIAIASRATRPDDSPPEPEQDAGLH